MMERYRGKAADALARRPPAISAGDGPIGATLATAARYRAAIRRELLVAAERDSSQTAAFGRAMVEGREKALVETAPIVELIEAALASGAR